MIGSIETFRVMTPDVYEREFHLPRGHATSFGGGPLAALRGNDPELTRYETAVPGLYLTGAATFRVRASGARAVVTPRRSSSPRLDGRLLEQAGRYTDTQIDMLKGSLRVGRIAGTTVRIHWTAVAVAALLGGVLVADLGVVVGAVGVVSFFVAILLHELAHTSVARRFDIGTSTIDLWGLGGMARLDREPQTPRAEGWIAAAGPLCNAALGALGVGFAYAFDRVFGGGDVVVSIAWFAAVNVAPRGVQRAPRRTARRWSDPACAAVVASRPAVPRDPRGRVRGEHPRLGARRASGCR